MPATASLALCLLWAGGVAWAQPDRPVEDRPLEEFDDAISVIEVVVPVQVTLGGVPLRGLRREQFRVYDRGQERNIVSFDETAHRTLDAPLSEIPEPETASPQVPRSFLLVFDATTRTPKRVDLWVQALLERTGSPANRDFYGVVLKGTSGYGIVSPLTHDPAAARVALELVIAVLERDARRTRVAERELRAFASGHPRWLAVLESPIGVLGRPGGSSGLVARRPDDDLGVGLADEAGFGSEFDVGKTLIRNVTADKVIDLADSLREIGTIFQNAPGERHLLLVSVGPNAQALITEPKLDDPNSGGAVRLASEQLFRTFEQTGWRVHGLPLGGGFNHGLFYLAEGTGGRVYENFTDPTEILERVDRETSVTYTLVFRASRDDLDQRRHELEVRVSGLPAGARVTHRPGYFAGPPEAP